MRTASGKDRVASGKDGIAAGKRKRVAKVTEEDEEETKRLEWKKIEEILRLQSEDPLECSDSEESLNNLFEKWAKRFDQHFPKEERDDAFKKFCASKKLVDKSNSTKGSGRHVLNRYAVRGVPCGTLYYDYSVLLGTRKGDVKNKRGLARRVKRNKKEVQSEENEDLKVVKEEVKSEENEDLKEVKEEVKSEENEDLKEVNLMLIDLTNFSSNII